jgi:hypothetical protein
LFPLLRFFIASGVDGRGTVEPDATLFSTPFQFIPWILQRGSQGTLDRFREEKLHKQLVVKKLIKPVDDSELNSNRNLRE